MGTDIDVSARNFDDDGFSEERPPSGEDGGLLTVTSRAWLKNHAVMSESETVFRRDRVSAEQSEIQYIRNVPYSTLPGLRCLSRADRTRTGYCILC